MPGARNLLVLHGISMSGASMRRTLGPLGRRLEELGVGLVTPNGAHHLSDAELAELTAWMTRRDREPGRTRAASFTDGRFWDAGEHYDWFRANTDKATGKKTYHALEQSLDAVAAALRERPVFGVLGFSQGAAMALVIAALATRGDARFCGVRCGVFLSGFKPVFDAPALFTYPIAPFPHCFVIGERDAIFPGNAEYLASVAQAFAGGDEELVVVPGLEHDVPSSAELVERLTRFICRFAPPA